MNVLFLTTNPNLGSTARILQCWLVLGRAAGLSGLTAVRRDGDLTQWLTAHGLPHRIDPMPLPDRRWPVPALWHAWTLARWARRAGVAVVHCNEHDIYPFGRLLGRLLGVPVVCHVRFRFERPYGEWLFGRGRAPAALLWTSQQQRDDCAAAVAGLVPADRQHLVPLGLDLTTFGTLAAGRDATRRGWGAAPDDVVVGTASALRPIKRIDDFIDLAIRLSARHPRTRWVVAGGVIPGDEAYAADLQRRVAAAGLGDRLRLLGHLEPVEPFLHAVDVFVSTSEYETFGNSVCEAMACRRPVAAYRGGSVHEVVGDAGIVVPNGDLTALEVAVDDLIARPDRRAELGDQARDRVARCFDPARTLGQLIDIYRSLTGGSGRPAGGAHREYSHAR